MAKQKKIGEKAYERISNWEGGMNNVVAPSLLGETESPLLENANLDQKGTLGVRKGNKERYSEDVSDSPIRGITPFYKSDGTTVLIMAVKDGKMYTDTPHLVNSFTALSEFEQGTFQNIVSEAEGKLLPMVFFTGFEDSSFAYFHTRDTGWKTDNIIKKTGTYSAKCTGEEQRLSRKLLFNASNFYIKYAVRFGEADKIHYPLIFISPSGTEVHALVADKDGKFKYHDGTALKAFPVDKAYTKDTFYDIEVYVRESTMWVAVDGTGVTPAGLTIKDTSGATQSSVSEIMFKNSKKEEETIMWLDDITINSLMPVFTRPTVIGDIKENTPQYDKILF